MDIKNYPLALSVVIAVIIFAVIFRYEYVGPRAKIEMRIDRWSGCVEALDGAQGKERYKNYAC